VWWGANYYSPVGPSPRVWGKLLEPLLESGGRRSIPTGVGKTRTRPSPPPPRPVHPHGCGENIWKLTEKLQHFGPSPRVWGKLEGTFRYLVQCRSIPTGVGKTQTRSYSPHVCEVHPHGCGENYGTSSTASVGRGPSPRVWGKHRHRQPARLVRRSIPTGVGKTSASLTLTKRVPVHPHGCGENGQAQGGQDAG